MSVASKQVATEVIFHDQAVPLGICQEGAYAVFQVGAREPMLIFHQVRQRFIEPIFLVAVIVGTWGIQDFPGKHHRVGVFVSQNGSQVWAGLQSCVQI